jgi:uncharacterized protein with PIN domain
MSGDIKFYFDEHVNSAVASGLRRRGVDVLTCQQANMSGAEDEEHLAFAGKEQRVIVTQDDDFLRLHTTGIEHAGIVYTPQRTPIGTFVRSLMLVYQVMTADEIRNSVEFL